MGWIRTLQMFADDEADYHRLLDRFIKHNECPRCENEDIKPEHNYCQICGFEVRELNEVKYINIEKEYAMKMLREAPLEDTPDSRKFLEGVKGIFEEQRKDK